MALLLTKINTELDMKPKEEPKKMIKKEELKKRIK